MKRTAQAESNGHSQFIEIEISASCPSPTKARRFSNQNALDELIEQAFGRQALSGPEEPEAQQRTIDSLSEQIARLQA